MAPRLQPQENYPRELPSPPSLGITAGQDRDLRYVRDVNHP